MNKTIVLDVNSAISRISRGHFTGIGRACFELVSEMEKIRDLPFDMVLYSQNMRSAKAADVGLSFKSVHVSLPYRPWINKYLSFAKVRTTLTNASLWHCMHNVDYVDDVKRTIFTLHDMILFACPGEISDKQRTHDMKILPPLIRNAKAVITCSQSSKNDIVKYLDINPEKVHVTPWGVRHDIFKPAVDIEHARFQLFKKFGVNDPYFFTVSCGYGRKRTVDLLNAYTRLLKNNPVNDLIIVWNDYGEDIAKIIAAANGRIRVFDRVNDHDLALLYSCATALIFPSAYEGFGLPVLEAMACGAPAVAFNNSALPEIGGSDIIYVDERHNDGIFNVLDQLENSIYNLSEISFQGLAHAAKFSWEKCALETIKIYQKYI